jgi:hypothetical protein
MARQVLYDNNFTSSERLNSAASAANQQQIPAMVAAWHRSARRQPANPEGDLHQSVYHANTVIL